MQCVEGWLTAWQGLGQWAITCPTETLHQPLTEHTACTNPHTLPTQLQQSTHTTHCTTTWQPTISTMSLLHHPAIHYIRYNKHTHKTVTQKSIARHRYACHAQVSTKQCSAGKCSRVDITARIAFFHCHCKTMRAAHMDERICKMCSGKESTTWSAFVHCATSLASKTLITDYKCSHFKFIFNFLGKPISPHYTFSVKMDKCFLGVGHFGCWIEIHHSPPLTAGTVYWL